MIRKPPILAILFAAIYCIPSPGQAPAATLYIELQNVVEYQLDTSDLSKYGTDPNVTQGKIAKGLGVGCAGVPIIGYADIVAVKRPAREGHVRGPRDVDLREPNSHPERKRNRRYYLAFDA